MNRWLILKDIALTGLGMLAIYSQIRSAHPNGMIIGAGLALTVPTIAQHVRALLPGPGDGESSPRHPAPAPPPSTSTQREESGGDR